MLSLWLPIKELISPSWPGLSGNEIHSVVLYFFVFSSFCSPLSCQYLLIAALALPVLVVGIQCNDGELFLDVRILILSPFLNIDCNSLLFPFTSHPIAELPILVWTA